MKNPLIKAFGLALLNVGAYLLLRMDELFYHLVPGSQKLFFEVSGGHFILFGLIGMLMILFAAFTAGRMSIFSIAPFFHKIIKR